MELRELRGGGGNAGDLGGICIVPGAEGGVQRVPTKADLFIEQLNATNAKKVALLLVLGFVLYHGLLNWNYGKLSICHQSIDLYIRCDVYVLSRKRLLPMAVIEGSLQGRQRVATLWLHDA